MAEVRFDQIAKSFGDVAVIENLSLHVRDQEFMVFVGPSGCGKSTALRMIAGLETVTGGALSIGGRVVNDEPPKARDCAMVFQSYALYPHMTVRENIAFGLKIRRMDSAEINRRVEAAAETLSLGPCLDRKPKALSGGQRQRVALGRALVRQPSVFLFDEPLSNLDAELRVVMRAEIARLQSELKTTTVYVTHDQVEAMTLGHRIAVLAPLARGGGRNLMQVGAPMELYNEPQNVFVARFLGTPNMNLVKMTVQEDGRTVRFGDAQIPLPERYDLGALGRPGSDVIVGFRPEHASADPNDNWPNAARLRGSVEIIETLGHEIILHLRCAGEKILAKTKDAASAIRLGDTIDVSVDVTRAHVFDPTTEVRVPYRSARSAAA